MSDIEKSRRQQLNNIVSMVKCTSLLFATIILFRYSYQGNEMIELPYKYYTLWPIIIILLVVAGIYGISTFYTAHKVSNQYMWSLYLIEDAIFIVIYTFLILISGAQMSESKYLFLFIIITRTIQSGTRSGILIASICSAIILAMDLILVRNTVVNLYFENDIILSGIFIFTAWPLGYYVKIENEHIEALKNRANTDGLTGVYNHRYFRDALRTQVTACQSEGKSISMIFIDIDHFKEYNDLYGHQKGDEILREMGELIKSLAREKGIVARYGGEEFAVLLPDVEEEEALEIAEQIRAKVEATYFLGQENQPNGNLTVSLGISSVPSKAKDDIELLKSADDALYRAKFFNRNRVETYSFILDELKSEIDKNDIKLIASMKTLISVINAKDRYTYAHTERVVLYSGLLGERLGIDEVDRKRLMYGAYMHDIGKINIPKEVLNKKMPLTEEEWNLLKEHPNEGVEVIRPVQSLQSIIPLIKHHHERYDGKGYPSGLKGEEIPYLARVLTVVDSFDAMTTKRPYNKQKTYEEAIEELKRCKGTQFDPDIVDEFIEVIKNSKDSFDNLL